MIFNLSFKLLIQPVKKVKKSLSLDLHAAICSCFQEEYFSKMPFDVAEIVNQINQKQYEKTLLKQ